MTFEIFCTSTSFQRHAAKMNVHGIRPHPRQSVLMSLVQHSFMALSFELFLFIIMMHVIWQLKRAIERDKWRRRVRASVRQNEIDCYRVIWLHDRECFVYMSPTNYVQLCRSHSSYT